MSKCKKLAPAIVNHNSYYLYGSISENGNYISVYNTVLEPYP